MLIKNTIFQDIKKQDQFIEEIFSFYTSIAFKSNLKPIFSLARTKDAHEAWITDIKRISEYDFDCDENQINTPDHFKQAAFLTYWLRRMSPCVDYKRVDNDKDSLSKGQTKLSDLLGIYANEYPAFDIGFNICLFFEIHRKRPQPIRKPEKKDYMLNTELVNDICYFLKNKNVSPHAINLFYKGVFHRPDLHMELIY